MEVQALIGEKAQLDARREELREFIDSHRHGVLPLAERQLIVHQHLVMSEYSSILKRRIAASNNDNH